MRVVGLCHCMPITHFPFSEAQNAHCSLRITLSHSQIMCVSNTDFHCTPNSFFFFLAERHLGTLLPDQGLNL